MIKQIRLGDIFKNCFDDLILVTEIKEYYIRGIYIEYPPDTRCSIPIALLDCYEKVENIFDRRKNNED